MQILPLVIMCLPSAIADGHFAVPNDIAAVSDFDVTHAGNTVKFSSLLVVGHATAIHFVTDTCEITKENMKALKVVQDNSPNLNIISVLRTPPIGDETLADVQAYAPGLTVVEDSEKPAETTTTTTTTAARDDFEIRCNADKTCCDTINIASCEHFTSAAAPKAKNKQGQTSGGGQTGFTCTDNFEALTKCQYYCDAEAGTCSKDASCADTVKNCGEMMRLNGGENCVGMTIAVNKNCKRTCGNCEDRRRLDGHSEAPSCGNVKCGRIWNQFGGTGAVNSDWALKENVYIYSSDGKLQSSSKTDPNEIYPDKASKRLEGSARWEFLKKVLAAANDAPAGADGGDFGVTATEDGGKEDAEKDDKKTDAPIDDKSKPSGGDVADASRASGASLIAVAMAIMVSSAL